MRIRRKKSLPATLVEQVADQAAELAAAVRPHVEAAGRSAADAVEAAVDYARENAAPALADARDRAATGLHDARDAAAPALLEARTRAATGLVEARTKAAPVVADARARAAEAAVEARTAAAARTATLRSDLDDRLGLDGRLGGEPPKRSRTKGLLIVGAAAAVGVLASRRLRAGTVEQAPWEAATPPAPVPAQRTERPADDVAAADPTEAVADATDEPHAPTTPDHPAEVVELGADVEPGHGSGGAHRA